MQSVAADPVLETKGLVLGREGRRIAALPDLAILPGQTAILLGASGSGKTTALLALAGIRPPLSGQIVVDGASMWALPAAARDRLRGRRIGLVFQSFHLVDAVSVAANVALAARCAALPVDVLRIRRLLAALGIEKLSSRRADRISHGQAQRVAIARALANKPAIVLADEPTSALDDEAAMRMLTLLKDCARQEGAGLLIATHDRRIAETADRVIHLQVER